MAWAVRLLSLGLGVLGTVDGEKVRPLFRKEEQYARAAASAWIAHPAVPSAVDKRGLASQTPLISKQPLSN
jgi:hypothetical protein